MNTQKKLLKLLSITLCSVTLSSTHVLAEEGGSGHYLPGSMASFMDGVPTKPTTIVRLNYINYSGTADVAIPLGGNRVGEMDATSYAYGLTGLWAPEWDIGEKWQFAMSATLPLVTMKVSGEIASSPLKVSDDITALGDVILMPLMANYNVNKDFNINMRLAFYAPTGDYETGRLANTGKNFWTIEPTIGFMYFGQQNGIEASLFLGADFNEENDATNYKSGTQLHLDGVLAQHFPLWNGLAGAGVTAYYYNQVTDDSGSGTSLGAFRAKAAGVGPVLSYVSKSGNIIGELKYINDFNNERRLSGDTIFFKLIGKF